MSEMHDAWQAQKAMWQPELERLAQRLHGGWRFDGDIMPVIVLTLDEAKALEQRLDAAETGDKT